MSKESVAEAKKRADALAKKKKAAEKKKNKVPRPRPFTFWGCSSVAERPLCMRKAQGSNPCSSSLQNNSVAQWIAYQTSNLGVAGSSPVGVVSYCSMAWNLKGTGSTPVSVSPRFGLIVWPSG